MRNHGARRPASVGPLARMARRIFSHLVELIDRERPSLADFRAELAALGLLGRGFTPEAYAVALGDRLGIEIVIAEYPDSASALMLGEATREGNLAEVAYNADRNEAVVLVRESLKLYPWPTHELQLYHELSHLAAGHPLRVQEHDRIARIAKGIGVRLARRPPREDLAKGDRLALQEHEASKRAKWLVLAGTSPEMFGGEGSDRLT